ncbi:O-acetylhomoserine aminocarboxypropyltransferase [Allostella humosa]|nr:O-acetylhomoserine aminocarboxypropyltransferase [Stella humosa]
MAVPIYQSTAFDLEGTDNAADLFALKKFGNIYSRIGNPTCDVLEQRMAALEGGVAALAVSSGQAATAMALQNIAHAGDNIVSSTDLYGGSWNLMANTFRTMGIEVRFVDPADPENFRRATDARTRAYYAETLPNPKLQVFPIAEVARIGEALGVPLIVDNTAAPVICRPLDHGAHIVVYSATKYVGGHGTSIGGMIVDGGRFDWEKHGDRFPMLTRPDPSYHGAIWTEAVKPLGPIAYIIKARTTLQRDLGCAMSPFNAFLFIQGLETLALRMREHCANAARVADWLAARPEVVRVIHPAHLGGEQKRRAEAYLQGGMGGLVGLELAGGHEAGRRFIDALGLFYHVANIGDVRSLAIHPASTTHSQLSPDEQRQTGVTDGYVRLSIGIEHIDDILADLDAALTAAGRPALAA